MTKTMIATLLLALPLLAEEGEKKAAGPGERAQKLIAKKDTNGDGKLTAEEMGVEAEAFARLDKDKDGFVTAEELSARRRGGPDGRRPGAGKEMVGRLLERHDKDKDGKLSKEEFPQGGRLDFAKLDKNSDGFVDKAELMGAMEAARGPEGRGPRGPSPEQIRDMAAKTMKKLDKNGDGKLTPDEIPARPARAEGDRKPEGKPEGPGKARRGPRGPGLDFAKADKNKDGAVDLFELTLVIGENARRGRERDANPRMLMKLAERMDANKDGKIDKAEWKGRPEMFTQLDANKDDVVTKDELEGAMKKMQQWRGRAGEAMMRRMDADKDGRISKEEWKLDAPFERFDRNKDGFIGADEVMLLGRGRERGRRPGPDARSGKSSAHFLQTFDKNGDGKVTKDEFTHERRFAEIDADSDGVLSKAEIEEAMDKRLRESGIGFFERFDLNGDGKVTREEFTGPASAFEAKDKNNDGVIDDKDK